MGSKTNYCILQSKNRNKMHSQTLIPCGENSHQKWVWWVWLECLFKFLCEMYLRDKYLQSFQGKKEKYFKILVSSTGIILLEVFRDVPRPFSNSGFSGHGLLPMHVKCGCDLLQNVNLLSYWMVLMVFWSRFLLSADLCSAFCTLKLKGPHWNREPLITRTNISLRKI